MLSTTGSQYLTLSHHTTTGEPSTVLVQNTPAYQQKRAPAKLLDSQPVFDKGVKNTGEETAKKAGEPQQKNQARALSPHIKSTPEGQKTLRAESWTARGNRTSLFISSLGSPRYWLTGANAQDLQLSAQESQQPAECNDSLQVGN